MPTGLVIFFSLATIAVIMALLFGRHIKLNSGGSSNVELTRSKPQSQDQSVENEITNNSKLYNSNLDFNITVSKITAFILILSAGIIGTLFIKEALGYIEQLPNGVYTDYRKLIIILGVGIILAPWPISLLLYNQAKIIETMIGKSKGG